MAMFGLFGGKSDKQKAKEIARATDKLRSAHVQTQERKRHIEILTDIGTPEAVTALLQRFTMRAPGSIVDEDEKQMAYQSLIGLGDVCVEPLKRFIQTDPNIYWPLRALTEIAGEEVAVDLLLATLDDTEHGFTADMERREQIASNLREYTSNPKAFERLVQLSHDESGEIRILAVDGLAEFDRPEVAQVMAERLDDPEESQRVKSTVLDILADRHINMNAWREQIKPQLSEGFFLDDAGFVQRR